MGTSVSKSIAVYIVITAVGVYCEINSLLDDWFSAVRCSLNWFLLADLTPIHSTVFRDGIQTFSRQKVQHWSEGKMKGGFAFVESNGSFKRGASRSNSVLICTPKDRVLMEVGKNNFSPFFSSTCTRVLSPTMGQWVHLIRFHGL